MFLGGINVASGNKPPWSLPAKAAYGVFDGDRAKKYFGATDIRTPDFFPILSILVRHLFYGLNSLLHIYTGGNDTRFRG